MVHIIQNKARKGRGSISNTTGRYETNIRHFVDDGWDTIENNPPSLRTVVTDDLSKTIITSNQSPDIPFRLSINPYRGCEHGCIYCFARPSHAYYGLSPGLDFETKLFAKPNAKALLEAEFRKPSYVATPIAIGTNTDPYQPIEKNRRIMRELLGVFDAYNHPVSIVTKSGLVLRDLDILSSMARRGLVTIGLSVTTLNNRLARIMEPRATSPKKRLETIQKLSSAGVPTFCLAAPMIPGLNDHELEAIIEAAASEGAVGASYILLRLPLEIKNLFIEWLKTHKPNQKSKIINLIQGCWGGKWYIADWDTRQRGIGPYADLLEMRMVRLRKRLKLTDADRTSELKLNTKLFRQLKQPSNQLQLL